MSVYSGFATRIQQTDHDNLIFNMLSLLSLRIIKFYKGEEADNNGFISILRSQNRQLRRMEKQQYMDPKYSPIITNLLNTLLGDDAISEVSSSYRQIPQSQKSYVINTQPYLRNTQSQYTSQKTIALQKIVERRIKRKKNKKKEKRFSSEGDIWNIPNTRIPTIPKLIERRERTPHRKLSHSTSRIEHDNSRIKYQQLKIMQLCQDNVKSIANGTRFRSKMYFK